MAGGAAIGSFFGDMAFPGFEAGVGDPYDDIFLGCKNAPNRDPTLKSYHRADFRAKTGIIRGSGSAPIVTPPQSRKVLQVQVVDRSTGWGQGSARFHTHDPARRLSRPHAPRPFRDLAPRWRSSCDADVCRRRESE